MTPSDSSDTGSEPQHPRVFLVEDHHVVRRGLGHLLTQQGFTVCGEADSVADGLAAIRESGAEAVILDLSLKDGDGNELLRQIYESLPGLPVLVFSMHEDMLHVERAFRAGAKGYITKQDAMEDVVEGLRAVLAGQTFIGPRVEAGTVRAWSGAEKDRAALQSLSERELEVYHLIGEGFAPSEIAKKLFLSVKTIETYCARLKEKFKLGSNRELQRHAIHATRDAGPGAAAAAPGSRETPDSDGPA